MFRIENHLLILCIEFMTNIDKTYTAFDELKILLFHF